VERIVKEVIQLSGTNGFDGELSSGSNSPGRSRRMKHRTLQHEPKSKEKKSFLVNNTLQHYNDCVKPAKEFEDTYATSLQQRLQMQHSKEQSVPDLFQLSAGAVNSPRGPSPPNKLVSRMRKRRGTQLQQEASISGGSAGSGGDIEMSILVGSAPSTNSELGEFVDSQKVVAQVSEKRKIETEKLSKIQATLVGLCESETNYLNKLQLVIDEFLTPMRLKAQEQSLLGSPGTKSTIRSSKGFMREFDGMNVFSNIESLHQISVDVSKELTIVLEKWPKKGIRGPFVMLLNVVTAYKHYIANWNNVHEILDNNKSPVSIFLQERAHKSQQDLLNLLSLPLTRLPQYEAVLLEILSTLPSIHVEYPSLRDIYQQLKSFVQELDSIRHRSENSACILRIMRRMVKYDGSLVEEGRLFIYEDQVSFTKNKKKYHGVMSLFSDSVLLARYGHYSNSLKFNSHLRLNNCAVEADGSSVSIFGSSDKLWSFRLKIRETSDITGLIEKEHAILISTTSSESKEKWLTMINKVIQNLENIRVFGATLTKYKEFPPFFKEIAIIFEQHCDRYWRRRIV